MSGLDRRELVAEVIQLVRAINTEKLEKLTERVARLEEDIRKHWSKSLDQEARITELEDQLHGHCINHSTGGH